MYLGQLLALYNCMVFIMHEIRTFRPQDTKSVNEHQFGDGFMLILFRRCSESLYRRSGASMIK